MNEYQAISREWVGTSIDLSGNADTRVYPGPCLLGFVYVSVVMSAHAVVLEDGDATKLTLPASLAAGTLLDFGGLRFDTNLEVNPNDASTGTILIGWRPLSREARWT